MAALSPDLMRHILHGWAVYLSTAFIGLGPLYTLRLWPMLHS